MFKPQRVSAFVVCALVIGAGGCGGDPLAEREIELVPVTGKVFMGAKPLDGATLTFTPRGSTKGTGGYAVTDDEGKFTAMRTPDEPGLEVGEYAVTFSKLTQPDGSPIPEGKTAADVGAVESIPAPYSDRNLESPATVVTVEPGGSELDLQVQVAR